MKDFSINISSIIKRIEPKSTSADPVFYKLTIEAVGMEEHCRWLLDHIFKEIKRKDKK